MNWLKDKKNLPIVFGLVAVVVVAAVVIVLFVTKTIGGSPDVAAAPPPPASLSMPPRPAGAPMSSGFPQAQSGMMGTPPAGAPGSSYGAQASGHTQIASATTAEVGLNTPLNVRTGPDPFKFTQRDKIVKKMIVKAVNNFISSPDFPTENVVAPTVPPLPSETGAVAGFTAPVINSTNHEVTGILQSNGVSAILESNGQSTTVQPGSIVDGAKVISIQPDGMTLKSVDNGQIIKVPLGTGSDSTAITDISAYQVAQ